MCLNDLVLEDTKIGLIKSVKYRKSRTDVSNWSNRITDISIDESDLTFDELYGILQRHSTEEKYNFHASQSKHPWTRNRDYRETYSQLRIFKRNMDRSNLDQVVAYRTLAASLRSKYDSLRTKYYSDIVLSGSRQSGHFYRFVKSLRSSSNSLPSIMVLNDVYLTGDRRFEILSMNLFNNFCTDALFIAKRAFDVQFKLNEIYTDNFSVENANVWTDFDLIFDEDEILNAIASLNESKGDGPMGISVRFIKFHANYLIRPISLIFNHVYRSGQYPATWKRSFLTPIPKKGKLNDVRNYRGIAMASVIPKLYDKLLTDKIYGRMSQLIPGEQHGFMKGKGTTTNLFETAQFISDEIAKGRQVDAIYFDFAKAFDRISHYTLARKLAIGSVPRRLYLAIMNFVIDREYEFKCPDCLLNLNATASSGVPQGSHMGPLLFVFYVRDILDSINHPSIFSRLLEYFFRTQ